MDAFADDVAEMSLDDYIAMCKVSNNNNDKKDIDLDLNNGYTKFGRRKGNIDDDNDEEDVEDNDDCIELDTETTFQLECCSTPQESSTIWKAPNSNISYIDCNNKQNDLRDKINNNRTKPTPIQYRLMAPNNSAKRPMGLPALLPLDAYVQNQTRNRGFRKRRGGRGRRREGGFNKINNSSRNFSNSANNGRVQRNHNQDMANRNLNMSFDVSNVNERESNKSSPLNLIVEQPSECISLTPSAKLNSSRGGNFDANITNTNNNGRRLLPFGNLTPQAESALNICSSAGDSFNMGNDSLKNMLGFHGNLSDDMMSTFAQRLLDIAKCSAQSTVHKPIYDMKIQKDIHAIQKKTLLYQCPGGNVVSSDGDGINCKIIPRTSGISMNCRFA